MRARRAELSRDATGVVRDVLRRGNLQANRVAEQTLSELRVAMRMD
jgi:hypothetical protein